MIQDVSPDILDKLPERPTDLALYLGGALMMFKMALNGMRAKVNRMEVLFFGDPTADPPKPGLGARLASIETSMNKLVAAKEDEDKIEAEVQRRLRVHVENAQ